MHRARHLAARIAAAGIKKPFPGFLGKRSFICF